MSDDSALEAYLAWLEPQVGVEDQSRSYSQLFKLMMAKEFVWLIANDDNRLVDGLDIRREFCRETGANGEELGPGSVLEVLIGLSRRLAFMAGGEAPGWAWVILGNLELDKMSDPIGPRKAARIDEILETVVWRTYLPDGTGGFFPLGWPEVDQTRVELWYQMAYYVHEIHPEY